MNLEEAIEMGKGIMALASELPQVPIDFSGTVELENEINSILGRLVTLRTELYTEDTSDICPNCDGSISIIREAKWVFLKKDVYSCSSCGYRTESKEEYELLKSNRIIETKGIAAAKFVGLAGRLVSRIGEGLEASLLTLVCNSTESIVLKVGEVVILSLPSILFTERAVRHTLARQTSNPNRTHIGGSLRIAKGAYIHLGGSIAQQRQSESISASIKQLFPKDMWFLVLTTHRFLFLGESLAATSFDLSKLVSASVIESDDGRQAMMLQIANRQRPVIILLQEVAFQPGGVSWPLLHPQLGIKAEQIVSRIKSVASAL